MTADIRTGPTPPKACMREFKPEIWDRIGDEDLQAEGVLKPTYARKSKVVRLGDKRVQKVDPMDKSVCAFSRSLVCTEKRNDTKIQL